MRIYNAAANPQTDWSVIDCDWQPVNWPILSSTWTLSHGLGMVASLTFAHMPNWWVSVGELNHHTLSWLFALSINDTFIDVSFVLFVCLRQADGEDELKKRQLMELAIINGTFRDTTTKPHQTSNPNTPLSKWTDCLVHPSPYPTTFLVLIVTDHHSSTVSNSFPFLSFQCW